MAREQGDALGDEVAYTHPDHPEFGERLAYTPTDAVNLEARGWVRKTAKPSAKKAAGSGDRGTGAESA